MIHFKFVGIKDMHDIYYLGLSGERSLPFGLLVWLCRHGHETKLAMSLYNLLLAYRITMAQIMLHVVTMA